MMRKELRLVGTVSLAVAAVLVLSTCGSSSTGTPVGPTAIAIKRYVGTGATAGTLDTTFGGTGAVATKIDPAEFEYALAVALQSDGKILAAGHSVLAGQGVIALVRYNPDGSLDTNFGIGGSVRTAIPSVSAVGSAIAVQADGKILVAGSTFNAGVTGIALARYNTDGTLDTAGFGGGQGFVSAAIGVGTANDVVALVLQGTDIVVAGTTSDGNFVMKRYDSAGTLDTTFGNAGTATTDVGLTATTPAIALQTTGMIILAGGALPAGSPSMNVVLVRYSANGAADATFGGGANGGIVLTSIVSGDSFSNAVVVQTADNKIVVAGHAKVNFATNTSDIALIRYTANGTLDGTFGNSGVVVTDLGAFDNVFSLALQTVLADVKMVVSGNGIVGGVTHMAVARYNPDGALDASSFNAPLGAVATPATGPSILSSGNAVAIQTDGSIVVAGYD